MDKLKTLPIRRHTTLLSRLPEILTSTQHQRKNANWIVYGEYLSPRYFEDIDFFLGYFNPIVDSWKVGGYEVALMAGELTPQHEEILKNLQLDYARLTEVPDLSKPGLIVMDMDSTAIQIECIDEIAKLAGVGDEVAEVTERAMQGELDFEQSLRQRVGKLANADASILETVREVLPLMPDLEVMIATLQQFGWKTAIASGGFTYFSDHLKQILKLDFAQSNQLDIQDGKLTGKVNGEIVTAQIKADILQALAEQHDIEIHNTIAIGDGANDLVMMKAAGLGIAYRAKPKVEAEAQVSINHAGLGGVVCILSAMMAKHQKLSWQHKPN